jgi:phage terminase large subunit-like protein
VPRKARTRKPTTGRTSPAKPSASESSKRNYAEIAHRYARDVVAGLVPACKWVRLACRRDLRDLARSREKDYPYRFDAARANLPCRFIEKLPHTRGQWARVRRGHSNRIQLEPWQIFIVCAIFGWINKATRFRRFAEAYIKVPRKNAKSTLAAAIGLYMLMADGEYGAEVYSGATKEKQAMEVFKTAWRMVRKTPALEDYFGIESAIKSLYRQEDGSKFEPLVGDPGDGASPSCAIVDEYHEHDTSILHDTMQTGMGSREQGLVIDITTAGSKIEGPCHILERDVEKLLDGLVENDALFGIMYGIDLEPYEWDGVTVPADDWKTETALRKANPNYGVSVFEAFLQKQLREAIQSAHKQNTFKTKHENVWVNAAIGYYNVEAWRRCADPSLKLDQFRREKCWEGTDLGAKDDLASRVKVFRRIVGGAVHYYVFGRHYVPHDRAMDGDHSHYERWIADDRLQAHAGAEIQLEAIQKEIEAELGTFDFQCLAFDPWGALQMQQELALKLSEDVVLSIPQTVQYLSAPMKEINAATLAGRIHHDGDPVLAWAISNVIAREDNNENVFPRKEKGGNQKIDPHSALLNAMNRAMVQQRRSVYETRGLIAV